MYFEEEQRSHARRGPAQTGRNHCGEVLEHQGRQTLLLQLRPAVVHVELAQQGWLSAPQVRHVDVSFSQPSPAVVQVLLAQQGCPVSPHTAQV
jgi:hypothetical protein